MKICLTFKTGRKVTDMVAFKSLVFPLRNGEINFWWIRGENVWASPKIFHHFSFYQTTLTPIFSPLISIHSIPPLTKYTLKNILLIKLNPKTWPHKVTSRFWVHHDISYLWVQRFSKCFPHVTLDVLMHVWYHGMHYKIIEGPK